MNKKIVLIGAGSANFGLGTISDIYKSKILEGSTITLHDINAKTLENTKGLLELNKVDSDLAEKMNEYLKTTINLIKCINCFITTNTPISIMR